MSAYVKRSAAKTKRLAWAATPVLECLCSWLLLGQTAAGAAFFDFESGDAKTNQFTQNFRVVSTQLLPDPRINQTDPTASQPRNDYLYFGSEGPGGAYPAVLTLSNANGNATFPSGVTVSFRFAFNSSGNVGVFFFDPANPNQNNGAWIQINLTGTPEPDKFISQRYSMDLSTGSAQLVTDLHDKFGYNTSSEAAPVFYDATMKYTAGTLCNTLCVVISGATNIFAFDANTGLMPGVINVGIALRFNASSGFRTVKLDDLQITTPQPTITIQPAQDSSGGVVVSWTGVGVLEQADAANGPWSQAPNQDNPQAITPTGPSKFFRISAP